MIRNFLFHRVNPLRDRLWDPMDVALFDKCVSYISNHYEVLPIEELINANDLSAKNKYATIQFDDGYKDNIEYAAPILKKYNCKASFYLVTDCIDKNIPTWTHLLEHTFQHTNQSDLKMDFDFLPLDLRVNKLQSRAEKINYVSRLKPYLKKLKHEERNLVLAKIHTAFNDVETPQLMMNWEDVRSLKNAGHHIGSHTVTHCMLGTMSDEAEIKFELQHSAEVIEKNVGIFPVAISYPVGSFNETTKCISKEVGYKIGLAVQQKMYNPATHDCFEIPRLELYNEPWWKTKLRITNTLENIKSLVRYR